MSKDMKFDFYYGNEVEQFSFFRIPKELIMNDVFNDVSLSAKLIYGMLHDRLSLSIKNGWVDEEGRVYICYNQEQLAKDAKLSHGTVNTKLKELDSKDGIGLIERTRVGQGRNDIIYVKNFMAPMNISERQKSKIQNSKNRKSRNSNSRALDNQKMGRNKTKGSHTETNQTDESINQSAVADCNDAIDTIELVSVVKENIDYDNHMANDCIEDRELFMDLYCIIIDIVTVPRDKVRMSKTEYEYNIVKSQFLKLTGEHIDYVIESYRKTTTEILDVKSYLITALYNAASTYNSYMANRIRHDQYGLNS